MTDQPPADHTAAGDMLDPSSSADMMPPSDAGGASPPAPAGPATDAPPPLAGDQALGQPETEQPDQPDTAPDEAISPERYREIAKQFGRLREQHGHLKRQLEHYRRTYDGIDPQVVQQWRAERQRAEQERLPIWHARHPEAPKFKQAFAEFRRLAAMHQRAKTDEAKAEIAAELERFPPEMQQAFEAYTQHRQRIGEQIAEELAGYHSLGDYIADRVQDALRTAQVRERAAAEVEAWFDDPANEPVVRYAAPAMREALQAGVPFPYVRAMAEMRYQLDALLKQLAQAQTQAGAAQAQRQAAQRQAAITPEVSPEGMRVDPIALAKERGIDTGSPDYVRLLAELSARGLL